MFQGIDHEAFAAKAESLSILMNERKNCWEYLRCGREPGGKNVNEHGICPAATAVRFDGVNGGRFGGRFCWIVSGTICNGDQQGIFAKKLGDCLKCPFFLEVEKQEGRSMLFLLEDYFRNQGA